MKVNKKFLFLRIITFPIKLAFMLFWGILFAVFKSVQWVWFGGDEIILGKDFDRNTIGELIKAVEKLTEKEKSN